MSVASHRLRELAETDLSYPGWEKDYEEASEACQIGHVRVFERLFHEIKEKQRAFDNHHILIRIEIIEELDVYYPGCQADKRELEEWCRENPVNEETTEKFEEKLEGLVNKHALYEGDRSHPNIVALDKVKFTFPGWEDEYEKAVRAHCDQPFTEFPKFFHQMKETQYKHEGKRVHWRLKTLDELELSYPGCRKDIAEVEAWHFNTVDSPSTASLFREAIDGLLEQEEMYLEAKMKEAKERKEKEEKGIFINQRTINQGAAKKQESKQTRRRDPTSDPAEMRTPTQEELYRAAKAKEEEERQAREEHERIEALKRQEMFFSEQMNHSRQSINNFVQTSSRQNNEARSTLPVAPPKAPTDESITSESESSVDSTALEVDRCYRRIAATLQMLEENKRIQVETGEDNYFHPQYTDQRVIYNSSSHHSRSHQRPVHPVFYE